MATLYCECKHSIWSDLWWTERGAELIFLDNLPSSDSYGKQVTRCPGCGKWLTLEILKSENYQPYGRSR